MIITRVEEYILPKQDTSKPNERVIIFHQLDLQCIHQLKP